MGKKSYYKKGGTNPQNKAKAPALNRSFSVSSNNILPMRRMKENLSVLRKSLKEKEKLLADYRKQNKKLMLENKKIGKIAEDLLLELEHVEGKYEKYKRFFMDTRDGIYR